MHQKLILISQEKLIGRIRFDNKVQNFIIGGYLNKYKYDVEISNSNKKDSITDTKYIDKIEINKIENKTKEKTSDILKKDSLFTLFTTINEEHMFLTCVLESTNPCKAIIKNKTKDIENLLV